MSTYSRGEADEWGNILERKRGRVEMWHSPKGCHMVHLYEHADTDDRFVMWSGKYNREEADRIFNTVVNMLR